MECSDSKRQPWQEWGELCYVEVKINLKLERLKTANPQRIEEVVCAKALSGKMAIC